MTARARLRALLWPFRIERDVHCELDLRQSAPNGPLSEGITVRVGSFEEVMSAADMRHRDAGENVHAEFEDRLRRGQKCFVAIRRDEVVGCNWLAFGTDHEGPVRIVLRDHEVLFMDAFTAISARGRSVHAVLQRAMVVWAKEQGYRYAYTFLRHADPAASKAIVQMGWRQDDRPRYTIISSPMMRQIGVRHQIVIDHDPGRHPVPRGPYVRIPPFEREPWE